MLFQFLKKTNIWTIILSSIVAVTFLYGIFYWLAPFIHSLNIQVELNDLAPFIRDWRLERDGVEVYALYLIALAAIPLAFLLTVSINRLIGYGIHIKNSAYAILSLVSLLFVYFVGINPPVINALPVSAVAVLVILGLLITLWGVATIAPQHGRLFNFLITIVIIPIIFIPSHELIMFDYSYVLGPAYKIISGFKLEDIYFQYDVGLSLVAAAWMKLHIDLEYLRIVAQGSVYALVIAMFFLSKKMLVNKQLPYYMLFLLILAKIFAPVYDPTASLQLVPLRLDLWILLLAVAYWKGIESFIVAVILGLLIIFHRTFGIIYLASYVQTLIILFFIEACERMGPVRGKIHVLITFIKRNNINIIVVGSSLIFSALFTSNFSLEAASLYRQIGIGFIQMPPTSFYWYVFVLIASLFLLILKHKDLLSRKYFTTSIFLIFLAIGNSLYYFGRSHDNNILLISASLVLVLFVFIDVLNLNNKNKSTLLTYLPILIIAIVMFLYSRASLVKINAQFNWIKDIFTQSESTSLSDQTKIILTEVKKTTMGDPKVFFMSPWLGFSYDYYGGYLPLGHFYPYGAWIYKNELVDFLQDLLNKNYYLVITKADFSMQSKLLIYLKYGKTIEDSNFIMIKSK